MRRHQPPQTHLLLVVALALGTTAAVAQDRPALRPADSARWETLVPSDHRLGLSPDGTTLAYRVDRANWEDELRITRLGDSRVIVVPYGRNPQYSTDGRWLAYSVGHSEGEKARLRESHQPIRDGLGLVRLPALTETRFNEVETFAFSTDGEYLVMERYATRAAAGRRSSGPRSGDTDAARLFVRALASGTETAFDNVQSFEWQPARGHLLAMIVGGDSQGGARVQLVNPSAPAASAVSVLDSEPATYARLAWRDTGADLAFLRSRSDNAHNGLAFDVVAVRGVDGAGRTSRVYDASRDPAFPATARIVDFRDLSWSADGRAVFVGIAGWDQALAGGGLQPSANPGGRNNAGADVRIWHWTDVEVMPRQQENLDADRRRNQLAVVNLDTGRTIVLAPSLDARASPIDGTSLAWVADWAAYAMDRTIGRPAADLSLVDIHTGQRTPFAANVDDADVHVRPDGGALVFLDGDHVWSLNTATRALTDLSAASGAALIDTESDETTPRKPLFGIGGWTTDGALVAYDRFDIWRIAVDGSSARKLTDGASTRTQHRLTLVDDADDEPAVDLAQPVYVELFGTRTKQFGYARLMPGGALERLIWQDRRIDRLTKAERADVYAYTSEDYDVSPNIFIGGPTIASARAATATNPQQARYAWGRSAVIDYTTPRGDALQAALYYPAGYVAGRRYPAIVKLYERLSDEVHDYVSPSDMDEANISIFTGLGYAVIAPDIRYQPRDPGVSTVACVTAAVARAVALGVADPARVGVIGHSWGAYGSAFLATHTTGVFAAAVAGSAITDLISQYGNHHWSTGVAETDHIETGQQRMQVPFYDDVDAYVRNSPIFGAGTMTTPLLLEAGDQDGEVFWHQSVELYNAARRAKKPVVLLQYPDEDHALDSFDNRRDYQRRILEWFGHYLKGEPAPPWMTAGTPAVKR